MSNLKEITFEQTFDVRWSDLDANFHVRHSAYADYCASTRLRCLAEYGFNMAKFQEAAIGPVLFKETLTYLREVPADERVRVNVLALGYSADGRKWKIRHELFRESDKVKAAIVEVDGAWMSTTLRKIVPPPAELRAIFEAVRRTDDFALF